MPEPVETDPTAELAFMANTLDRIHQELSVGNLADIGHRITLLRQISGQADATLFALMLVAAEDMEADQVHIPSVGWLVRTPKYSTAGSDAAGARRAARMKVAEQMSIDHTTGEIKPDWRQVASAAIDLYEQAISLGNPKRGFQDVLGLQLDEYMHRSPAGYSVDVHVELP